MYLECTEVSAKGIKRNVNDRGGYTSAGLHNTQHRRASLLLVLLMRASNCSIALCHLSLNSLEKVYFKFGIKRMILMDFWLLCFSV